MHKRLMHASPRAIADTTAHTQGSKLTDDPPKLTTPIDEAPLRGKVARGIAPLTTLVLSCSCCRATARAR